MVKFKSPPYSPRNEELAYKSRKSLRCGRKVVTIPMIPEISAPAAADFKGDPCIFPERQKTGTLTIAAS